MNFCWTAGHGTNFSYDFCKECEEKLKVSLNKETRRRRRLEDAAASTSGEGPTMPTSQGFGSVNEPSMPPMANSWWTGAGGAAFVIPKQNEANRFQD